MASKMHAQMTAAVLKEYNSRLGIDGSSQILVTSREVASSVEEYSKQAYLNYLPTITIDSEHASSQDWQHKEGIFTHIIAHISSVDKASLQLLKWTQWSLMYKGILLLLLDPSVTQDDPSLIRFVEDACFERARIRVLRRAINVDGEEVECTAVLAMKWDLLCA